MGHEAVVELLLAKDGVNQRVEDDDSRTQLSRAVENELKIVIQLLLTKYGVGLNIEDEYGQTPLSWAAGNGYESVVKLLLEKDCVNPDSKDSQSGTVGGRERTRGGESTSRKGLRQPGLQGQRWSNAAMVGGR
jgi:ankyrin repeat protein